MDNESTKITVVQAGTELTGSLTSTCPVEVNGKLDGDVKAPELTVTPNGQVLGAITVKTLRSEGVLSGSIDAEDVYLAGQVAPNTVLKATSLEVKLNAGPSKKLELMFAECTLEIGEDPEIESPQVAFSEALQESAPPPAVEISAHKPVLQPQLTDNPETPESTSPKPSTPPEV